MSDSIECYIVIPKNQIIGGKVYINFRGDIIPLTTQPTFHVILEMSDGRLLVGIQFERDIFDDLPYVVDGDVFTDQYQNLVDLGLDDFYVCMVGDESTLLNKFPELNGDVSITLEDGTIQTTPIFQRWGGVMKRGG